MVLAGEVADARLDALRAQREHQPVVAELALGPGHPFLVGEVHQVHGLPPGQPVPGGQRHVRRVVQEMGPLQAPRHGRPLVAPVQDDREVRVAAQHRAHPRLGLQLRGAHAEFGMAGAQGGERAGNEPAGRRREGREPHLAHDPAALGLDVGLGELDLGEDPGGVLGEQQSGVGEAHAPAVLGEQLLPHLALQLGQLLGDGRGGDVQPVGGTAHRAVPRDGVEGPQALQIQHVSNPKGRGRRILTCSTRSVPSP